MDKKHKLEKYDKPHGRQQHENAYRELIRGVMIKDSLITLHVGAGHMNVGSNVTDVISQLIDNDDCFYLHAIYSHHPRTLNRPEFSFRAVMIGSAWSLRALVDTGSDITMFHRGGRNSDLTLPDICPLLYAACLADELNYNIFYLLSAYDGIGRTHWSFVRLAIFRLVAIGSSRLESRETVLRILDLIVQDITESYGMSLFTFILSRRGRLFEWRRGTRQLFPYTDLRVVFENDDVEMIIFLLDLGLDCVNIYGANGGGYLAAKLGAIKCLIELARRGVDVSARKRLVDMLYRPVMVELFLVDVLWYCLEYIPHVLYSCATWLVIDTPRRAALVRSHKVCLEFMDAWVEARRAGYLIDQDDCEMFVKQWAVQKSIHISLYDMTHVVSR